MTLGPFADFQDEVYLKGLAGEQPTLPFGRRETEDAAHAVTSPEAAGGVAGGSGGGETGRADREAPDRRRPADLDRQAGLPGHRTVRQPSCASLVRT